MKLKYLSKFLILLLEQISFLVFSFEYKRRQLNNFDSEAVLAYPTRYWIEAIGMGWICFLIVRTIFSYLSKKSLSKFFSVFSVFLWIPVLLRNQVLGVGVLAYFLALLATLIFLLIRNLFFSSEFRYKYIEWVIYPILIFIFYLFNLGYLSIGNWNYGSLNYPLESQSSTVVTGNASYRAQWLNASYYSLDGFSHSYFGALPQAAVGGWSLLLPFYQTLFETPLSDDSFYHKLHFAVGFFAIFLASCGFFVFARSTLFLSKSMSLLGAIVWIRTNAYFCHSLAMDFPAFLTDFLVFPIVLYFLHRGFSQGLGKESGFKFFVLGGIFLSFSFLVIAPHPEAIIQSWGGVLFFSIVLLSLHPNRKLNFIYLGLFWGVAGLTSMHYVGPIIRARFLKESNYFGHREYLFLPNFNGLDDFFYPLINYFFVPLCFSGVGFFYLLYRYSHSDGFGFLKFFKTKIASILIYLVILFVGGGVLCIVGTYWTHFGLPNKPIGFIQFNTFKRPFQYVSFALLCLILIGIQGLLLLTIRRVRPTVHRITYYNAFVAIGLLFGVSVWLKSSPSELLLKSGVENNNIHRRPILSSFNSIRNFQKVSPHLVSENGFYTKRATQFKKYIESLVGTEVSLPFYYKILNASDSKVMDEIPLSLLLQENNSYSSNWPDFIRANHDLVSRQLPPESISSYSYFLTGDNLALASLWPGHLLNADLSVDPQLNAGFLPTQLLYIPFGSSQFRSLNALAPYATGSETLFDKYFVKLQNISGVDFWILHKSDLVFLKDVIARLKVEVVQQPFDQFFDQIVSIKNSGSWGIAYFAKKLKETSDHEVDNLVKIGWNYFSEPSPGLEQRIDFSDTIRAMVEKLYSLPYRHVFVDTKLFPTHQEFGEGKVESFKYLDSRAAIKVNCPKETCLLVFNVSALNGWKAWTNQSKLKLGTANFAFLGADVPKGSHWIWYEYRPWVNIFFKWVSMIVLLVAFLILIYFPREQNEKLPLVVY